jgi:ATP-dependent DNA helicase RecG
VDNIHKLTDVQNSVLKYLSEHPTATRVEISKNLDGVSENGVKYTLSRLQRLGLLKRVGGRKEGHWEIHIKK